MPPSDGIGREGWGVEEDGRGGPDGAFWLCLCSPGA